MFLVFLSFLRALAASCPPPDGSVVALSADGAAHLLAADAGTACWWIVDDTGDPRVGARWDRARRDPVAFAALADGRVVVALREDTGRVRLGVREEGAGERRFLDLPAPPARLVAHDTRPLVAVVWAERAGDRVWLVDVDAGARTEAWLPAGAASELRFEGLALRAEGLALSAGGSGGPR